MFVYKSSLKIVALISNSTVEQRAVISFLWSEGVKASEIYRRMLVLRNKCECFLSEGVRLFHGNACPHSAATTIEAVGQLKFELLPHPPYNLDLASSDYHMFGPLKET
jgi:hypothetical protein